jgi:multiple antibiotic resistance protein
MQLAIAALFALLPIINPFSTAPMFLAMTEGDSDEYRQKQARKAVIYMVCILIAFLVSGSFIMSFFGLSLPGLRIAGGILVAGVGMRMLRPKDEGEQTMAEKLETKRKRDISFTPLAMPSLAGPGAISVTIGLTSLAKSWLDFVSIIIGILLVAIVVYLTLRLSTKLVGLLGVTGLNAMTKIMGFLILCVGVQFIVNGIVEVAYSPELIGGIIQAIDSARAEHSQ